MTSPMKSLGIDRLGVEERLVLVYEIWDSIATNLSDAQRDELKHRVAEHERDPRNVVPWNQVKADATARLNE